MGTIIAFPQSSVMRSQPRRGDIGPAVVMILPVIRIERHGNAIAGDERAGSDGSKDAGRQGRLRDGERVAARDPAARCEDQVS